MPCLLKLGGYAFIALKMAEPGCPSILKQRLHLPMMIQTSHHSQLSNTCLFFTQSFSTGSKTAALSGMKSQTQPVVISASESLERLSNCGNIHHLRTKTYKAGCPKWCKPEFFKGVIRCQSLAFGFPEIYILALGKIAPYIYCWFR